MLSKKMVILQKFFTVYSSVSAYIHEEKRFADLKFSRLTKHVGSGAIQVKILLK